MTDSDAFTDTTDTPSGSYDSCASFVASLNNNNYLCWEFDDDDWTQYWQSLGMVYYIYIGHVLVLFALYRINMLRITGIRLPSHLIIVQHTAMSNQTIYILLNIIIHILYLLIKIIIVSSNHLSTACNQYENMYFQQFLNIHTILLVAFFTFNPGLFWMTYFGFNGLSVLFDSENRFGLCLLIIFGYILLFVDALFSLIIICIYYPLLIVTLYFCAVGLLSLLIVSCALFCIVMWCSSWLLESVTENCLDITVMNGVIYFDYANLCKKNSVIVLVAVGLLVIVFCVTALEFWGAFAFVGGPTHYVMYLDFNEIADLVILCLLIAVILLGAVAVLASAIQLLCYSSPHEMNRRRVHLNEDDDSDDSDDDDQEVLLL